MDSSTLNDKLTRQRDRVWERTCGQGRTQWRKWRRCSPHTPRESTRKKCSLRIFNWVAGWCEIAHVDLFCSDSAMLASRRDTKTNMAARTNWPSLLVFEAHCTITKLTAANSRQYEIIVQLYLPDSKHKRRGDFVDGFQFPDACSQAIYKRVSADMVLHFQ